MINYLGVLVCGIISMVVGFVWYGPLFGKVWMEVMGVDMKTMTPEKMKEMQKGMGSSYLATFVLALLTNYVLAVFIIGMPTVSGVMTAFWIWLGFVMPVVAGSAIWSGKPKNLGWKMFLTSAGYQLVTLLIYGAVLGAWPAGK